MKAVRAVRAPGVGPTSGQERYEFLDVLRGAALAGIVLANMISLSLYLYLPESHRANLSTARTDQVFDFLELVLIESKFYTIFSILFGIGFSILITRAEAKGMVFRRFFLRRALFLYVIGLAHGVLLGITTSFSRMHFAGSCCCRSCARRIVRSCPRQSSMIPPPSAGCSRTSPAPASASFPARTGGLRP